MRSFGKVLVILLGCFILLTAGFALGTGVSFWAQGRLEGPTGAPANTLTPAVSEAEQRQEAFRLFWEAWDILQSEFYGDLPDLGQAARNAIKGVLQHLGDPNTFLLDPEIARVVSEDMSGQFEGIGALVQTDENGYLVIVEPFEGGPAARAGILAGDIVLEADGEELLGLSSTEAVSKIRGPRGTTVTLLIYRPSTDERFTVEVVRERIDIPTIETRWYDDNTIFYLRLREFNATADDKVHQALKEARKQGAKGIILDLRGNPGGLLDVAISVASEFVSEGIITEERTKDGQVTPYMASPGGAATDPTLPVVVLVNQGSASASEIVAGAIQDTGRGILVGTQTYGKGSVQKVHELSDGSQLRVTIAHWFTPGGRDIHEEGLSPDVEVTLTVENMQAGQDKQLDKALELLREKISAEAWSRWEMARLLLPM